ncbi:hypothetical protein ZOD2009_13901 [Haladaptatus paucihalophilus DX253]|uniref:Uncharacterized protein n=1 Tax=Haladaptatus paucihalophilus DX253 TaxID=797209 RepID=E7QVE4_HALPU|nr:MULTISPECIES: hypothetical protein [Haladaptatus]EFW91466.1 hypothetical protein ZOD2009_13901 [Haladaptatus paucihalophilus DX253]ODR79740.1 hypothetical protein BG842_09125 [Haladaptatus sp. W1]GKZ15462.1 hypothetical protein HAL_33430 [Haladaptatus sp. T7]SHL31845.1 hypothetical protein SAMN05444342_3506 [Haladaptatus paucihalophilus DX253]
MNVALKPLIRLAITFAIVWFYSALLTPLDAGLRFIAIVVLAIPTWLVVSRALFADDDWSPFRFRRDAK